MFHRSGSQLKHTVWWMILILPTISIDCARTLVANLIHLREYTILSRIQIKSNKNPNGDNRVIDFICLIVQRMRTRYLAISSLDGFDASSNEKVAIQFFLENEKRTNQNIDGNQLSSISLSTFIAPLF